MIIKTMVLIADALLLIGIPLTALFFLSMVAVVIMIAKEDISKLFKSRE